MLRRDRISELIWSDPSLDEDVSYRPGVLLKELMGHSRGCRTLSWAVTSTLSCLPLWTDVDPSCECRWEVALSLSKAVDWILTETSSPSTHWLVASFVEWLPGAPSSSPPRSSKNQLPVSHFIKLVSRCLHLKLRKQEET